MEDAQQNLVDMGFVQDIGKVAADKGYYKAQNLVQADGFWQFGFQTYIAKQQSQCERVWNENPGSQKRAVYKNRDRCSRDDGKAMQRRLTSPIPSRAPHHATANDSDRRNNTRGRCNV